MIGLRVDTHARNGVGDFIKSLRLLVNCPCESHDYDGDRHSRRRGAKEPVKPEIRRRTVSSSGAAMPELGGAAVAATAPPSEAFFKNRFR